MSLFYKFIDFLKELHRRNNIFFYLGTALFLLSIIFFFTLAYCQLPLYRMCFWFKPFKFAISFALYVYTLGWFLEYLKPPHTYKWIRNLSWIISLLILLDMTTIITQSWIASGHFFPITHETAKSLSRYLYLLSNTFIILNSTITIYIALQFFRNLPLRPESYLWAIRAGFATFIFSAFLGGFLIDHYGQMPTDPNQYGIPFTQFNSTRDHIVSLHFLGIHFIQILPISSYYFPKQLNKTAIITLVSVYVAICLYFVAATFF